MEILLDDKVCKRKKIEETTTFAIGNYRCHNVPIVPLSLFSFMLYEY